jgi:hypothetical protein
MPTRERKKPEISNGSLKFPFPRIKLDGKIFKGDFDVTLFSQNRPYLLPQAEIFGHPLTGRYGKFPRFDITENTRGRIEPDGFDFENLGAGLFIFHPNFQRGDGEGIGPFQTAITGERDFNLKGEGALVEELGSGGGKSP